MSDNEFGKALGRALEDTDITRKELGAKVAVRLERERAFGQSSVSEWIGGANTPDPPTVFAIESVLGLRPGTLSKFLGYLPTNSRSTRTVRDAIDADPKLTASGRRIIGAVYEELVGSGE